MVIKKADLSIIIPCFNEEKTIAKVLSKVLAVSDVAQVIVIDDCSSDLSYERILEFNDKRLQVIKNVKNLGKGASIRSAQPHIKGKITIIQDADLEYDPEEFTKLVTPIRQGIADAVYGSRFQTSSTRRVLYFWHYLGNKFLTTICNMVTNINLSDMETCHKAIESEIFRSIKLKENRFGFEPEITCKLANRRARFYEVSISYMVRTYEEGKKIGIRDGFAAIWCVFRYSKLFDRDSRNYLKVIRELEP